ncbi:membrane-associated oxidoreductase [Streptomyces flavofungini]|uniref:membrane-associated oxidoreductase n=1 Tax=Streptomyces flavofungini TaxID=68200 RepID=UPI0034DEC7D8
MTGELSEAERRVWEAFPYGRAVDFGESRGELPRADAEWGPDRTVRAEVLRALLLGGSAVEGHTPVLRVTGARVSGTLDLQHAEIAAPIHLKACLFDATPELYGAQVRQLTLSRSLLPGLHAIALRADGSLRMPDSRVLGPVRLGGARITGGVTLYGAHLGERGVAPAEPVLAMNHVSIADDLRADRGFTAHGEVRLEGAAIAGRITLDDAVLSNPGGTALRAANLGVGSDLRAARLAARGRVDLLGARIPGTIDFEGARLSNPGGVALRASSLVAGALWLRDAPRVEGAVTLRGAQLDFLYVAPDTWPDAVRLDGLTYARIGPAEPVERRLELLERDTEGYVPFAYEQLTAAYRRMGDDAAARTVQLTRQRRQRASLPWYARAWGHLQDVTVGYGFRPTRAAVWLLSLLLVGTVTYALREPSPLKPGEAPEFNALFYTLDLLLPIVSFGQEQAYASRGVYQWVAYALIVLGWTLATTVAAGITRSLSRQ